MTFSKEQAGMAYLAVFMGYCSKLRNSLSRREFFRQGDDYYRAFNLRGPDGEEQPGPLPEGFEPDTFTNQRALQIMTARCLEEECRSRIKEINEKQERGSLRKGAHYLARIIYLRNLLEIGKLIECDASKERKAEMARGLAGKLGSIVDKSFDDACGVFRVCLADYLSKEGGNEDAALKNSAFAKGVDAAAEHANNS